LCGGIKVPTSNQTRLPRVEGKANPLVFNQWQHVAATWDGSTDAQNKIHIYVNGVQSDGAYVGAGSDGRGARRPGGPQTGTDHPRSVKLEHLQPSGPGGIIHRALCVPNKVNPPYAASN